MKQMEPTPHAELVAEKLEARKGAGGSEMPEQPELYDLFDTSRATPDNPNGFLVAVAEPMPLLKERWALYKAINPKTRAEWMSYLVKLTGAIRYCSREYSTRMDTRYRLLPKIGHNETAAEYADRALGLGFEIAGKYR